MKKIMISLLMICSVNLFAASDIEVKDAFIKPTLPGMVVTAMFVKIINNSDKNLNLVKVQGDFAGTFELHNMEMSGARMVMRPVEAIVLKSKSTTELKSGGYHVMIFDVKKAMLKGETYPIKLILDNKTEISAIAKVK